MRSGFRLEVRKEGLIFLDVRNATKTEKVDMGKQRARVRFLMRDADGNRFERCLKALRPGDIIEIRFLPFLPKEAEG